MTAILFRDEGFNWLSAFCFMHSAPSHYQNHTNLLTCNEPIQWKPKRLAQMLVGYILSSVCLISSLCYIFYFRCSNMWGCMCKTGHSSLGDREDTFVTHPVIIIKSKVSNFPNVVICAPLLCASGGCTIICCLFHIYPTKSWVVCLYQCTV